VSGYWSSASLLPLKRGNEPANAGPRQSRPT
jgi:hypothetical protein